MTTQPGQLIPEFTVGDRLRKARESAKLSQGELADEIGISRATVSNHELSITPPRKIVLNAWSMRTGVPVEWLLTGTTLPPPSDPTRRGRARRDSNPQPSDPKSHGRRVMPMIVPAA